MPILSAVVALACPESNVHIFVLNAACMRVLLLWMRCSLKFSDTRRIDSVYVHSCRSFNPACMDLDLLYVTCMHAGLHPTTCPQHGAALNATWPMYIGATCHSALTVAYVRTPSMICSATYYSEVMRIRFILRYSITRNRASVNDTATNFDFDCAYIHTSNCECVGCLPHPPLRSAVWSGAE